MKKSIFPHTLMLAGLLFAVLFTSCTEAADIQGTDTQARENTTVLTISAPQYTAEWDDNGGTRGLRPLDDILQKQIHNLWYYFYNEDQMLTYVFHQNITATTIHTITFQDFVDAAQARGVTFNPTKIWLYVIANSENVDNSLSAEQQKPKIVLAQEDHPTVDYESWRATIANVDGFRASAILPLYISGRADPNTPQPDYPSQGLPGHIMLFGGYHGMFHNSDPDEGGHTISLVLGRAVSRMRVSLSGEGLGAQARITIQNAPIVTTLFPDVQPLFADGASAQDCWMNYMEMISTNDAISGSAGNRSSSTHYYCSENSTHSFPISNPGTFGDKDENGNYTGKVSTTLIVETWDTYNAGNTVTPGTGTNDPTKHNAVAPNRTYRVVLGHDVPSSSSSSSSTEGAPRDLNLYRNTSYTFNVTLRTGTAPASNPASATRSATQEVNGETHVWPQ